MKPKRGHGEGSLEWDGKRNCYFVKVTYIDPETKETKRKKLKGTTTKKTSLEIGQKWLKMLYSTSQAAVNNITLEDWITQWLEEFVKNKVRPKSYDKYESCLLSYVKPTFGSVRLVELNTSDIQKHFNKLLVDGGKKHQGISTSTVKATRRYLIMCLDKAIKKGLLEKNAAKNTEPPKIVKQEIRPLTEEQSAVLLAKARETGPVPLITLFIALSTGMRLGEVFGLMWQNVNLEKGIIHVKRTLVTVNKLGQIFQEPKTTKSRRKIPLPEIVRKELVEYKKWQDGQRVLLGDKWENNDLVIANSFGKPYDTSNFTSRTFKNLLRAAVIDHSFKFHDLRHTHATLLLQQGVHPKVVQERLGHSTITMTLDTYSHLLPDMQDTAVKAMEDIFDPQKDE